MKCADNLRQLASWLLAFSVCAVMLSSEAQASELDNGVSMDTHIRSGDFASALTTAQNNLQRAQLPEEKMRWLNNIGWLRQQLGQPIESRQSYEESVLTGEKDLPQSPLLVNALSSLGAILYSQNDLPSAQGMLEKALKLAAIVAPKSSDMVDLLSNYAGVLDALGERDKAEKTYRKALEIATTMQPANKVQLAQLSNGLACYLSDSGKPDEASKLFAQSLGLQREALGENSLEVADTLNNLGVLAMDARDLSKARDFLQRSLSIYEATAGKTHIATAAVYLNLGDLNVLDGDTKAASRMYLQSARAVANYFSNILPGVSLAEQQAELVNRSGQQLSRLLSFSMRTDPVEAYGIFNQWKGALVTSMRNDCAANGADETKLAQLRDLRSKLAAWYLNIGHGSLERWQQTNAQLTRDKEKLERELSGRRESAPAAIDVPISAWSPQSSLADDQALIDIYKYDFLNSRLEPTERYCAVRVLKGGVPTFIDLGDAAAIDALHRNWLDSVLAGGDAAVEWNSLRDKLEVTFAEIPDRCAKILVCPDGELARLPWQLLGREGKFQISQIDAPQELLALNGAKAGSSCSALLAVGGVDFGAQITPTESEAAPIKLEALPGTLSEIRAVVELARKQNRTVTELIGKDATKEKLLSLLPSSGYAHIATHGFFFEPSTMSAARHVHKTERGVSLRLKRPDGVLIRNPLVESGLALAGANRCGPDGTLRSGFLSAEEIVGTKLPGCRLVVLSACDTGRGEQVTGQGVLGLRAALMSAGVRTVVMSLWKVPDLPTTELMRHFYVNLWEKQMGPAAALRSAQLTMSAKFPDEPASWAGWTLVGDGW